ncbi:MAG: ribonuclease III [bacterium]|nr:ribonuclease III [bacterium]
MKDFAKLQKKIGTNFKDEQLLINAFIHRSYLNENSDYAQHNERLEFLGDAVLELVTTEFLYQNYPNPEGDLTNWRSALVKTETISDVSKSLGFEDYLFLSRGESKSKGRARQLILANCFEAVIGATYLDRGYDEAKKFITKHLLKLLPEIIEKKLYVDAKSQLQEIAQRNESITPRYDVLSETGPDHKRVFKIGVFLNDKKIGEGEGASKQLAQQAAAEDALKSYK